MFMVLLSVCTLMLVVVNADVDASSPDLKTLPNFYAHDVLDDGETQRTFHLDGVAAKETSAIVNFNGTKEGAILRQVTKGHHLIQLIYDADDVLTDCELVSDRSTVRYFVKDLVKDYRQSRNIRPIERAAELPSNIGALVDYRALKSQCRKLHSGIRRSSAGQSGQGHSKRSVCGC